MRPRKQSISEFTAQSPWLDLVNSEQWDGFGNFKDHLLDRSWVTKFLRYWNLHLSIQAKTAYKELAGLRNGLRRMAERIAMGRPLRSRELRLLNNTLKVPARQTIAIRNRQINLELTPLRSDWAWIRSRTVVSFVQTLAGNGPKRIKICPNTGCRWVFYDSTKGNVRRWCNDRRCGNRDRARRARAREKKKAHV